MLREWGVTMECCTFAVRVCLSCAGSADGTVRAWDVRAPHFKLRGVLKGHEGVVYCLLVVKDKLFSGSADRTLRVWDTTTFACEATLADNPSTLLSLAATQGFVYASGQDGTVRQWRSLTMELVGSVQAHKGGVYALLGVGERLIAGSSDGSLSVWMPQPANNSLLERSAVLDDKSPPAEGSGEEEAGAVYALASSAGTLFSGHQGECTLPCEA